MYLVCCVGRVEIQIEINLLYTVVTDIKLKRFEGWSLVREKTKEKRPRENALKSEFTISNGCTPILPIRIV